MAQAVIQCDALRARSGAGAGALGSVIDGEAIGSSISASSAPEAGRCHGSFERQRRMIFSRRGSMSGFKTDGLSGRFLKCIAATSIGDGATKGRVPVASRNMMTPQE